MPQPAYWLCLVIVLAFSAPARADVWTNAESLLSQGTAEDAEMAFDRLVRQHPDDSRAYSGRGRARLSQNNHAGAVEDFTKVISLKPQDSSAYHNRALAYQGLGEMDLALADFDKAIALDPKDAVHRENRGALWRALQQWDKAVEDLQAASELDPDHADTYGYLADVWGKLGEYEKAVEAADKAIALNPNHLFAWTSRALAVNNMNDDAQAVHDFEKSIEVAPKNPRAHNFLGFFLLNRGENQRAMECFNTALKLEPDSPVYLNNRGQCWLNLGQMDKALADFDAALALNPNHAKAYRNRALCHLLMNEPQKALEDASNCIELTPEESRAWRTRAEAETMLEREAEAARDMEQAVILGPQPQSGLAMWVPAAIKQKDDAALKAVIADASAENRQKLAQARHEHAFAILENERREPKQHELEEAVALARSACVLAPENAAHPFLAGLLYHELAAFDERALPLAETMFEQATEVDEEHAAAWLELGLLMMEQDRPMEAIAALEQALTHDPVATVEHALGPLCAIYAANDEGLRGLDFFEEQYDANPEVPALAVGRALMLYCLGDHAAALRQLEDIVLIEPDGSAERDYAQKLIAEWKGTTP